MAVQTGLCRTWSETPKTGFSQRGSYYLNRRQELSMIISHIIVFPKACIDNQKRHLLLKAFKSVATLMFKYEPRYEKTGFLHMRNKDADQLRNCAADQRLCFRYMDSTFPLLSSRGRGGLVVYTSDSGFRGRRFEPHSGRRVVSRHTQEAVAPSEHDGKIDKHQTKPKTKTSI